ncbi:MAG: Luciferase family protein [Methanoculleus marisnigri]|uniref:Luciferase family protein n=1 Tax=Methanoculleus marisnigri TaxID=2198 RepID=A0A101IPS9_9EURY|nr:MAG: Luciferase family protein [Methanoculleus marisnigri]
MAANKGELNWIVPTPTHFEQLQQMVTPDDVAKNVLCGPDPQKIIEKVGKFVDMGYDSVVIHQVGPEQQEFINLAHDIILPEFGIKPPRAESGGRMVLGPGPAR